MWRTSPKTLLCRCCCGAIDLTKSLRWRPANTNFHTIKARNAMIDRFAGDIQQQPGLKLTTASVRFSPMPAKYYPASGAVSAAASPRLAACYGVNHQDFVLLARDSLEAF